MNCKKCGTYLNEEAHFCGECGSVVGEEMESIEYTYCNFCGEKIGEGNMFCGKCGMPITVLPQASDETRYLPLENNTVQYNNTHLTVSTATSHASKGNFVPFIVVLAVIVIFAAGIIVFMIHKYSASAVRVDIVPLVTPSISENNITSEKYSSVHETLPLINNVSDDVDNKISSIRKDLYSSSLTYKRMDDIHQSKLTDDETYIVIKNIIQDFDEKCETYINNGNNDIFKYLRPGTTAYEQQVSFKTNHPGLKQYYEDVDVVNARHSDNYFYAWVSETLNMSENGKESQHIDHWVYKLAHENGNWYIEDYTSDPAY